MLGDIADDQQERDVRALQTFLYILIRDHLPSGVVHGICLKDLALKYNVTRSAIWYIAHGVNYVE